MRATEFKMDTVEVTLWNKITVDYLALPFKGELNASYERLTHTGYFGFRVHFSCLGLISKSFIFETTGFRTLIHISVTKM